MIRFSPLHVSLVLLSLCAFLLVGVQTFAVSAAPAEIGEEAVWAQSVVTFKAGAGTIGSNFSDPKNALGPVDASIVSMGNAQVPAGPPADPASCEAVLIVDFGQSGLVDGEGDDLTIYESAVGSLLEPTWVYIGGPETSWRYVGEAAGGKDTLDISGVANPGETFSQVAICDIPDGDTTIGATPGPDIDAIAANHVSRLGLVAQAQGPGWFVDSDPARQTAQVFMPMPVLSDLFLQPPVIFRFECPEGEPLEQCTSFLTIRARCGGELTLTDPALYLYPIPLVSIRDLQGGYEKAGVEQLAGFCGETLGKTAVSATEPMAVFSLQEGGLGFAALRETWHFELLLPAATVNSVGLNRFTAVHDPASRESTLRILGGEVVVDPAASADPFRLTSGQQVIITAGSVGQVTEFGQLFLPVMME